MYTLNQKLICFENFYNSLSIVVKQDLFMAIKVIGEFNRSFTNTGIIIYVFWTFINILI